MNQYPKNRKARVELTRRAGYSVPAVFEFEGKNGTNSTDLHGMKRAHLLCNKSPKFHNIAPAINPLIGCSFSKMDN
jgi:hypothetical protein